MVDKPPFLLLSWSLHMSGVILLLKGYDLLLTSSFLDSDPNSGLSLY